MQRVVLLQIILLFTLVSCSSKVEYTKEGKVKGDIRQCYDDNTPAWVFQPAKYSGRSRYIFVAVGSFACYNIPPGECRDPALHNARANLANQLIALVRQAVKDYKKTYAGGINIRNYEALSQSIVETILLGTEHIDTWISRCGEVYTLVGIPKSYAPVMAKVLSSKLKTGIAGVKVASERDVEEFVQFLMTALTGGV